MMANNANNGEPMEFSMRWSNHRDRRIKEYRQRRNKNKNMVKETVFQHEE